MTRADRLRRWSARALYAAGATTALLNLLGRLGTWDWRLDLLVHFKPQVATLLAAVALALFGLGRRRGALAFAALCAIEVVAIAPYYLVAGTAEAGEKPAASALSLNLMRWNEQYGPVREYIQAQAPDVVTLQEVDRPRAGSRRSPRWKNTSPTRWCRADAYTPSFCTVAGRWPTCASGAIRSRIGRSSAPRCRRRAANSR